MRARVVGSLFAAVALAATCPLACATAVDDPGGAAPRDGGGANNGGGHGDAAYGYDVPRADAPDAPLIFEVEGDTGPSGKSDGAGKDAPTTCGAGTTTCAGGCVDLGKDPGNCGACGKACAASEVCSSGLCAPVCGGGTTKCGSSCADLTRDSSNCGSCGHGCLAGETCTAGSCAVVCPSGTTKCGAACVDLAKDPGNCGACGTACGGATVCVGGACSVVCGGGTTKCGSSCVDTATDPANCGGCGVKCGGCTSCSAGACAGAVTPLGFPASASTTRDGTLGAGGGARYFQTGDFVQQTFPRAACATSIDLDFYMSDFTDSFYCPVSTPLRWNVVLNGTVIGTYTIPGGTGGPFGTSWQVKGTVPFAAVASAAGSFTVRFEAIDTVCSGGGSWDWIPGGTVTLH